MKTVIQCHVSVQGLHLKRTWLAAGKLKQHDFKETGEDNQREVRLQKSGDQGNADGNRRKVVLKTAEHKGP